MSPCAAFLPIAAGFGYSLAVVFIRRALVVGAPGGVVNLACNSVMALLFQTFWLVPCEPHGGKGILMAVLCGVLFFVGQVLTFRAIATGDVSVSTPLMGTKVLFVGLFTVLIARSSLQASWWWACLMASAGIALISFEGRGKGRNAWKAVPWSLAAAAVYAMTDLFVQTGVPLAGYQRFAPIMFGTTGLLSLSHLPRIMSVAPWSGSGRGLQKAPYAPWLWGGAGLLAVQSLAMYSAIGLYGSAALTNILYGSRCLWSVLMTWLIARLRPWEAVPENPGLLLRRLLGAILIVGAMTLVLTLGAR